MLQTTFAEGRERTRPSALYSAVAGIAASSTFGMAALVHGLIRSAGAGWGDALTQGALAAGLLLLAAFILIERRAAQPILPLHLFAYRQRNAAYGARVLFMGAMIGFFFFTTQFLQVVLRYSPSLTGLAFLPMTLLGMAWLSRVGAGQVAGVPLLAHRVTLALGSAAVMLALALLLVLSCRRSG
ncbi:hypothetical protein ACQ4WP_08380 [Janthinobacterium sp. GB4P2]|uniref:hypothetical protein n=1 Tax=Janthinobacterium sp. GB4P2 TaxID=3424189 RepID=UPI003F2837F9